MKKAEFQLYCNMSLACWGDKYKWKKLLQKGQKISHEGQVKTVWFTIEQINDMMQEILKQRSERGLQSRGQSVGTSESGQGKTGDSN